MIKCKLKNERNFIRFYIKKAMHFTLTSILVKIQTVLKAIFKNKFLNGNEKQ